MMFIVARVVKVSKHMHHVRQETEYCGCFFTTSGGGKTLGRGTLQVEVECREMCDASFAHSAVIRDYVDPSPTGRVESVTKWTNGRVRKGHGQLWSPIAKSYCIFAPSLRVIWTTVQCFLFFFYSNVGLQDLFGAMVPENLTLCCYLPFSPAVKMVPDTVICLYF